MRTPRHPVPAHWSCIAARDDYIRENGFDLAEYEATRSHIVFFGKDMIIPNPPRHRQIIKIHDLHHVLTGYGTCHVGEGELAMWEWRAGVLGLGPWAIGLTIITALMGFVYAPRRMLRAWQAARGARPLWAAPLTYDELLTRTVGELRTWAGMPSGGLAHEERRLHKNAPTLHSSPSEEGALG